MGLPDGPGTHPGGRASCDAAVATRERGRARRRPDRAATRRVYAIDTSAPIDLFTACCRRCPPLSPSRGAVLSAVDWAVIN